MDLKLTRSGVYLGGARKLVRLNLQLILLICLISCKTVAPYKVIYSVQPDRDEVCYFKKFADLSHKKVRCYGLDQKYTNGKFMFEGWILISIKSFKELLNRQLDEMMLSSEK